MSKLHCCNTTLTGKKVVVEGIVYSTLTHDREYCIPS